MDKQIKSFINTLVKHKTKVDGNAREKISCAKIQACTSKNITPEQTFHLFYTRLFLSNLVLKFNIVLIGIFKNNFHRNLFNFLPFDYDISYFTDLEVYPVLLRRFIRTSKILMRLSVSFEGFQLKAFLLCSYFSRKMLSNGL